MCVPPFAHEKSQRAYVCVSHLPHSWYMSRGSSEVCQSVCVCTLLSLKFSRFLSFHKNIIQTNELVLVFYKCVESFRSYEQNVLVLVFYKCVESFRKIS